MKLQTEKATNKIIDEVFKEFGQGKLEIYQIKREIKKRLWK